jgi:hypothetical protein
MRVEKWAVISAGTVLTVALAVVGGNALAATFNGPPAGASPAATVSALASPSPLVTTTPTLAPTRTPTATSTAIPSPTTPPTGTPSPSPSPPSFTLGWYPADSATFDASVIDALPIKPQVVNYYSGWNEPFNASFARAAYADGIETFVEMEPWNCGSCASGSVPEMTDIASGGYDGYLTSFGQAIKAFGHPVLVTFAHEMNGGWYPWGYGGTEQTTPAQWISAWDHVVTVVNAQAPGLVTWVWAPNVELGATSIAQYWPGAQYVGEVGLDGYLSFDSATYQSEFGQTVADVRAITDLPIWITETGVNQDDSAGDQLAALATALKVAGLTGMLYFDQGPAALNPEEEQILADVIGPWLTLRPTSTPTLPPTPAPTPTTTPSPTVTSPSPSPSTDLPQAPTVRCPVLSSYTPRRIARPSPRWTWFDSWD